MAATYSQSKRDSSLPFNKLLNCVKKEYPELRFVEGKKFAFRPPRTIVISPNETGAEMLLLHEVSHALCEHKTFVTAVERVKKEAEAWDKAKELAVKYAVSYDENDIESELDTYRDWLHQKSRCPRCGLTRFQTPDSQYHCPKCENLD